MAQKSMGRSHWSEMPRAETFSPRLLSSLPHTHSLFPSPTHSPSYLSRGQPCSHAYLLSPSSLLPSPSSHRLLSRAARVCWLLPLSLSPSPSCMLSLCARVCLALSIFLLVPLTPLSDSIGWRLALLVTLSLCTTALCSNRLFAEKEPPPIAYGLRLWRAIHPRQAQVLDRVLAQRRRYLQELGYNVQSLE